MTPIRTTAAATAALGSLALGGAVLFGGYDPVEGLTDLMPTQFVEDVGGAERINYAGKLRMLSQRIPAAACNEAEGVAVADATAMLEAAVAEFDRIVAALEHGDEGLGILGPESDRKVLYDIQAMHAIWDPLHVDMDAMIAGDVDRGHAVHIAEMSPQLLDIAKHLVSVVVAEHSDPTAVLQADALTIDIAGRQRMLAQRISKNACLAQAGMAEGALAEMAGAMEIYDVSMRALHGGLPEAGIQAPPTPAIAEGMTAIVARWEAVTPLLERVQAGETLSVEARGTVFAEMNALTAEMNAVVGLYAEASKQGL